MCWKLKWNSFSTYIHILCNKKLSKNQMIKTNWNFIDCNIIRGLRSKFLIILKEWGWGNNHLKFIRKKVRFKVMKANNTPFQGTVTVKSIEWQKTTILFLKFQHWISSQDILKLSAVKNLFPLIFRANPKFQEGNEFKK